MDITANRLFGPQPRTSTYICVWEIRLGHVKGVLSASEGQILAAVGKTFMLNFVDTANAPAAEFALPADPDSTHIDSERCVKLIICAVTTTKVSVGPVNLIWLAGSTAVDLTIPCGITLNTNDLAGDFYRKVTSIQIPTIVLKVLVTNVTRPRSWLEAAHATLDVNVDIYSAPAGWRETSRMQEEFIRVQDAPTGRAKLMKESLSNDCKPIALHGILSAHYAFRSWLPQKWALFAPATIIKNSRRPRKGAASLVSSRR